MNAVVKNNSLNTGGMFVPYQFIAMDFKTDKSNTATFYHSVQASSNSRTNYPGSKVWTSNSAKNPKSAVLDWIEGNMKNVIDELEQYYPEIKFEVVD